MSLAVVVIASTKRMNTTFPEVMKSVAAEPFDEIICVADFHSVGPWRHLMIPAFTKTTIDALIKRDVGWAASRSDHVLFLSDDHKIRPGFVEVWRNRPIEYDIVVPTRFCVHDGKNIELNMGRATQYCAGHAGIFRRTCGQVLPWTACIPHPNWDVIHTHHLIANGCSIDYAHNLYIEDIEPNAQPWI